MLSFAAPPVPPRCLPQDRRLRFEFSPPLLLQSATQIKLTQRSSFESTASSPILPFRISDGGFSYFILLYLFCPTPCAALASLKRMYHVVIVRHLRAQSHRRRET